MIEVVFKDGKSAVFEGDKWGMGGDGALRPGQAVILATAQEEVTAQIQWDEVRSIRVMNDSLAKQHLTTH